MFHIDCVQMLNTDNFIATATVPCIGRYAFRPVSTTESVPEASSEDEMTEKILLGQYDILLFSDF